MAILDPVFANKQGQTPQDIERRRRMAQQLLAQSQENERITSPWQGAAKVAQALMGGFEEARANRDDKTNRAAANDLLAKTLLGEDPSTPAATGSASQIPAPGAAGEMSATSPGTGSPDSPAGFAATMLGKGEAPDRAAIQDYLKTGGANLDPATTAWCAAYVNASLGHAGIKGTGSNLAKSFLNYGEAVDAPKSGDIAVFSRGDPKGPYGHVGFYDRMNEDGTIRVLGGNQGDSVSYANYPSDRLLGYRRPASGGGQVASLDPAAGMSGSPAAAPQPGPPTTGRAPMQGPTAAAPALAPPTTVASAPPVASVPQQQPASLMSSAVPGQAPSAPSLPQMVAQTSPSKRAQIAALLQNPYTQEAGQQMLMQEYERQQQAQNLILKQQLEQNDPKYRQDLQKGQLELEQLRNPRIGPADQARLDLERQKFEADRNKPTEVNGRLVGPDGKVVYDSPMSAADEARLKLDRDKFDAEVEKGQWEKLTDGRIYNRNKGEFRDAPPPLPGSVTPKFDDVSGMRKEIQQLPSYKNLAAAAPIYKAMAETAGRDSKASDLNLVYGLGKIMDPTSVVREGEMVMVKNTASLPDWLQGAIASLNGGAALTPETRQAIMTEAYGRVKGYNDEFQQNMGQYQGIVQRNGINPADVIPDVDKFEPWVAPAAAAGAVPGAAPQQGSAPVQIQNVDDYNGLPKGTQYLDPNGKLRTKQ